MNAKKQLRVFFTLVMLLLIALPSFGQTIKGRAAGDFYSAFAKMGMSEKRLGALEDLRPFIPGEVLARLREDMVYRAAFIAFAANQHGVITGITGSSGFAETLNALTGFLMIIEKSGGSEEWTIREISGRYEQLLASSWRNVNPSLFTVMLEAYCQYMRGELWEQDDAKGD